MTTNESADGIALRRPAVRNRSPYEVGAEIIATLMHAPRTWPEVDDQVGLGKVTSARWFKELRASGVLRVCGFRPPTGHGCGARIFELQAPFAKPDVERGAAS